MGKVTALVLGLAALAILATAFVIVVGVMARAAQRIWTRVRS